MVRCLSRIVGRVNERVGREDREGNDENGDDKIYVGTGRDVCGIVVGVWIMKIIFILRNT